MSNVLGRRPSAALIVAVTALVVALGGTAVAAKKLGLGSLSAGAKKKTVGVGKLTYATAQQTYSADQLAGFNGYFLTANCPSGTHVVGGGTKLASPTYADSSFFLVEDYPSTAGFTSHFYAGAPTQADTVQVTAICGVSQAVTASPPAPGG
jgi:hypothetical protein